jgi:hypothetical protein
MKIVDRLKKIEAKTSLEKKIFVVKYQTELKTLEYGDEEYLRLEGETEDEFIERILAIVKKSPHPNGCYLVGNIY